MTFSALACLVVLVAPLTAAAACSLTRRLAGSQCASRLSAGLLILGAACSLLLIASLPTANGNGPAESLGSPGWRSSDPVLTPPFALPLAFRLSGESAAWIIGASCLAAAAALRSLRTSRSDASLPCAVPWLMLAAFNALALAETPFTLLVAWEWTALLAAGVLVVGRTASPEATFAGPMLLSGWLMDGVLIASAATASGVPLGALAVGQPGVDSAAAAAGASLAIGGVMAAAGRVGLFPVSGVIRGAIRAPGVSGTLWTFAIILPAAVMMARGASLAAAPELARLLAGVLGMLGVLTGLSAWAQRDARRAMGYVVGSEAAHLGAVALLTGVSAAWVGLLLAIALLVGEFLDVAGSQDDDEAESRSGAAPAEHGTNSPGPRRSGWRPGLSPGLLLTLLALHAVVGSVLLPSRFASIPGPTPPPAGLGLGLLVLAGPALGMAGVARSLGRRSDSSGSTLVVRAEAPGDAHAVRMARLGGAGWETLVLSLALVAVVFTLEGERGFRSLLAGLPVTAVFAGAVLAAWFFAPNAGTHSSSESALLRLARADWGVPGLWKLFVMLPLAGGAQLVRLFDWLLFGLTSLPESPGNDEAPREADRPVWFGAAVLAITTIVLSVLWGR